MLKEEPDEFRNSRLDSVALTDAISPKNSSRNSDEPILCCIPFKYNYNKTSFSFRIYDQNDYLICICFDCCTWIKEFYFDKCSCCSYNYTCFCICCKLSFQ